MDDNALAIHIARIIAEEMGHNIGDMPTRIALLGLARRVIQEVRAVGRGSP